MKNEAVIATLSQQLKDVASRIESLSLSAEVLRANDYHLDDQYDEFMFDELRHAQLIVLELTKIIAPDEKPNTDGSMFGEGELTAVKGEVENEKPERTKE